MRKVLIAVVAVMAVAVNLSLAQAAAQAVGKDVTVRGVVHVMKDAKAGSTVISIKPVTGRSVKVVLDEAGNQLAIWKGKMVEVQGTETDGLLTVKTYKVALPVKNPPKQK